MLPPTPVLLDHRICKSAEPLSYSPEISIFPLISIGGDAKIAYFSVIH